MADYKEKYLQARQEIMNYLDIDPQDEMNSDEKMPLRDLVEIIVNKYNEASLYNSLTMVAYKQGVAWDKFDDYMQAASELLFKLENEGNIDSEQIEELALQFR